MAISATGIIFSSLNNNTLSRLTSDRTVAAIPFACRYRLIDFALSNLVNANISNINIVANYNYRSLLEHIGSGKDWDLARRKSGVNIISPFQTAVNSESKVFATRMEALKNMKEYIAEFTEEFVVMMDSDIVLNIDIADVIAKHEKTGANITIVTQTMKPDTVVKHPRMMISSVAGKVTDIAMSQEYNEKNPELSLNIFVMRTQYLRRLIEEAEAYNLASLTTFMLKNCKSSNYRTYKYSGFVASVSSFTDYYQYSMELVKSDKARDSIFGKKEFPIFTRVHNSAPTAHKQNAKVENSMIADECVIEGTVINSVIFRDVKVEAGAVVKNSVLFHGTHIGKDASLNCIVTDKDVFVTDGVTLSGNDNMPFYI
ncbi:MAG: glucose-1-phosphate adenylyltransferase subunit GlgD, partial [Clostridia bacterium]|nr:glucose-1-phosphate adenylyltransferase subunit GlgD [Clostridia bacterium]